MKLTDVQNKYLQVISKVYKITSVTAFKTEIYILFLNLYLDTKLAKFCQQHKQSEMKEMITKSCAKIQIKLQTQYSRSKFTVRKHKFQ